MAKNITHPRKNSPQVTETSMHMGGGGRICYADIVDAGAKHPNKVMSLMFFRKGGGEYGWTKHDLLLTVGYDAAHDIRDYTGWPLKGLLSTLPEKYRKVTEEMYKVLSHNDPELKQVLRRTK